MLGFHKPKGLRGEHVSVGVLVFPKVTVCILDPIILHRSQSNRGLKELDEYILDSPPF